MYIYIHISCIHGCYNILILLLLLLILLLLLSLLLLSLFHLYNREREAIGTYCLTYSLQLENLGNHPGQHPTWAPRRTPHRHRGPGGRNRGRCRAIWPSSRMDHNDTSIDPKQQQTMCPKKQKVKKVSCFPNQKINNSTALYLQNVAQMVFFRLAG